MSVIEFRGVTLREGAKLLLSGFDLALGAGERLVVFGASGSGKSDFLKLAAGVASPASGAVVLLGPALARPAPVGYVPNQGGLINNLTLAQNVALPALYHKLLPAREAEARSRAFLAELGQSDEAERRPAMASAAARRMAQLARALLVEPALFVLEHPLEDMDSRNARLISGTLERIRSDANACAILGTRKLGPYLEWGSRFLLLSEGGFKIYADKAQLLREEDQAVKVFLQ